MLTTILILVLGSMIGMGTGILILSVPLDKTQANLLEANELNEKLVDCLLDCQKENLLPENCQSLIKEKNNENNLLELIKSLKPIKLKGSERINGVEYNIIILENKISIGRDRDGKMRVFKNGQRASWLAVKDIQEELCNILKTKTIEVLNN